MSQTSPEPPPLPQLPHPLSANAYDHLLQCGLGMRAVAQLQPLDSQLSGQLASTAISAMAVIAVRALPNIAADVEKAAEMACTEAGLIYTNQVAARMFMAIRDTWRALPHLASMQLRNLVEVGIRPTLPLPSNAVSLV